MTFVITQTCIDVRDQSCVDVCPVDCIHFEEGEDRILYIDPVECIDCGACVPVCPEDAIFDEPDLPEDQRHFTEINALWYQDPAAARAQVDGAAAAEAPAEAATAEAPAEAAVAEAPAEDQETAVAAAGLVGTQVEAPPEPPRTGALVPQGPRPLPSGLIFLASLAASLVVMFAFPGPRWLSIAGVDLHVAPLLLSLPALAFLLLLVCILARNLAAYAARRDRDVEAWREAPSDWRRSEESRLYELASAVRWIAEDRFPFPNEEFPNYRTYVNVPEPSMAIEFGEAGGERMFPDIVVVEYPGNYPVIVAQVETRETLTRAQAERVWRRLQTAEAPLNLYVPAGLAGNAKDYARAAGIEHVRFRTWRHNADRLTIREL